MKTLDEVIKALEICTQKLESCYECPYYGVSYCINSRLDALHYLKIFKAKSEEPPLGNSPDYIPLDFHQLAKMIGEPVYIKEQSCKGHWEIITAVRKTVDGEDYAIRGNNQWQRIGNHIYRTKEGSEK